MSGKIPRFMAFFSIVLVLFMLFQPRTTLDAARNGLALWFNTVLPGLFPFLVVNELLLAYGVVNQLGRWLEPVMRPLFRLPGAAAFPVVMGFTSGFPVGAVVTRRLLDENLITVKEAERLVAFTNNASPLFILGVIGTGLFQQPALGYLLAVAHYLSNFMVGILLSRQPFSGHSISEESAKTASLPQNIQTAASLAAVVQLLRESILKSLQTVTAVGGFIIIFSVLAGALTTLGFTSLVGYIFQGLGLSYASGAGFGVGLLEITLGSQLLASAEGELLERLLAVSAVLAWSGLSIQSQILSIMADTPVNYTTFFAARALQAVLSVLMTLTGYQLVFKGTATRASALYSHPVASVLPGALQFWHSAFAGLAVALVILLAAGLAVNLIPRARSKTI